MPALRRARSRLGERIIVLHGRYCRPWTISVLWLLLIALGVAQVLVATHAGR